MNIPNDLLYTKTHEWIQVLDGGKVRIGITDFAQQEMGDVVYVELPQVGDAFSAEDELAVVETQKAASDIFAPVTGEVSAVNNEVVDKPEIINEACYDAWLVEMKGAVEGGLLSSEEYEEFLKSEGK